VTDDSELSAMNSIPLSQLLMEMNADSSDSLPDSQSQPSQQFQCSCITAEHQAANICIEHFTIRSDDERRLNNIAGNLSDVFCIFQHCPKLCAWSCAYVTFLVYNAVRTTAIKLKLK